MSFRWILRSRYKCATNMGSCHVFRCTGYCRNRVSYASAATHSYLTIMQILNQKTHNWPYKAIFLLMFAKNIAPTTTPPYNKGVLAIFVLLLCLFIVTCCGMSASLNAKGSWPTAFASVRNGFLVLTSSNGYDRLATFITVSHYLRLQLLVFWFMDSWLNGPDNIPGMYD